jgi:hypothetical protein
MVKLKHKHAVASLFCLLFCLALPALACQTLQRGSEALITASATAEAGAEAAQPASTPLAVLSSPAATPSRTPAPVITVQVTATAALPTATAVPPTFTPIPATATAVPVGSSRSNPFPFAKLVQAPNWDIQVLQLLRGESAWEMIAAANMFNNPAPPGMEYVLVKLYVKNNREDGADASAVGNGDFKLTGSHFILYRNPLTVAPSPILRAEVYPGGEIEGWVVFMVRQGEDNLILVFDELFDFDRDKIRFLALHESATVEVPAELAAIQPTETGKTRHQPAAWGETIVTEKWEVTVLDLVRGSEAAAMVTAANRYNDPPAEGMEYVVVKLRVRLIVQTDEVVEVSGGDFKIMGSANVIYNLPTVVDPEPGIRAHLYPGGIHEGWHVTQVAKEEGNLVLVYEPLFDFSGRNKRFLALAEK